MLFLKVGNIGVSQTVQQQQQKPSMSQGRTFRLWLGRYGSSNECPPPLPDLSRTYDYIFFRLWIGKYGSSYECPNAFTGPK